MPAVIVALLFSLLSPSTVEHWLLEWQEDAVHQLDVELLGEWKWMRDNYPCEVSGLCAPPPAPRAARIAPQPSGGSPASVESWRPLVSAYFPAENVDAALRVLACESVGDPNALNPSSAAGLFQFIRSTWDWIAPGLGLGTYDSGAPFDPTSNVLAAAHLSKGGSTWSHWSCKP